MTDDTVTDPGQPGPTDDAAHAHALANQGPFTPDQLRDLAQQEVNAGRLSLEDANESLRADGAEPLEAPAEPSLSPTAAEALDMAIPPARPQDFDMGPIDDSPKAAEQDTAVREWLSAAGFDRGTGSYVGKEIARVAESLADATDADVEVYHRQQQQQLHNLYGDRAPQMVDDARAMAAHIEAQRPGFVDYLVETGAADSVAVIQQLAHQAQRVKARNGK